jgi:hypothetical protein
VGREYANPRSDRPATTTASGWRAARPHSGWGGRCRRSRELRRLCFGKLLGDGRRWSGRRYIVILAAPAEIHDVVVVSVLENAQEVSFAQAFTVASEELARRRANLARARGSVANGPTNKIERVLASEPQSTGSDLPVR